MLTPQLERAQQAIRGRHAPGFTWILNETGPWTPLRKPLAQTTVALASTCGLYRADTQLPFGAWNDWGDPSFREIHTDTPTERLRIAHTHYEHTHVAADPGVALPIEHLHRLAAEGIIGQLHPWAYSFMGFLPEAGQLLAETAPLVAERLRTEGVEAALLTPC